MVDHGRPVVDHGRPDKKSLHFSRNDEDSRTLCITCWDAQRCEEEHNTLSDAFLPDCWHGVRHQKTSSKKTDELECKLCLVNELMAAIAYLSELYDSNGAIMTIHKRFTFALLLISLNYCMDLFVSISSLVSTLGLCQFIARFSEALVGRDISHFILHLSLSYLILTN